MRTTTNNTTNNNNNNIECVFAESDYVIYRLIELFT